MQNSMGGIGWYALFLLFKFVVLIIPPPPFFLKVMYASSMQTLNEIERELTRLFPTRLTDLFEFLVASGTSRVFLSN